MMMRRILSPKTITATRATATQWKPRAPLLVSSSRSYAEKKEREVDELSQEDRYAAEQDRRLLQKLAEELLKQHKTHTETEIKKEVTKQVTSSHEEKHATLQSQIDEVKSMVSEVKNLVVNLKNKKN